MIFGKIKQRTKSIYMWFHNRAKKSPLYWRTLIMLFFVALIVKWIIIYISYRNLNPWENVLSYLASDIIVLFIAHLLVTINYWIKKRKFRLFNDFIVLILLLVYVVDMFTIFVFHSRVSVMEAFALWSNWSLGFDWIVKLRVSVLIIVWMLLFILLQTKLSKFQKSWKNVLITFSFCSIIYAIFYIFLILSNIKINYVENIIDLNLENIKTHNSVIEQNETENVEKWYSIKSVQWEGKDVNIILVFAESLSAIDSANAGWNDKMPKFDQIQRNGITFTNFIANWTTSDTAHIATLLWVLPLVNMKKWNTPYSGYKLKMDTLPEFLNKEWYMTTFVSAASLNFLRQRDFLSWAWFQKIIWEEEFEKNKSYTFKSAPDGDLYDRVLQEVQTQTWKYFIWLQTISFHKPYDTPLWKTEDLALQYSDEELYRFYERLQEIWFFDNWILVIVWDHRKMNPVEEWEPEVIGPNRYMKSVATIVWAGIQPQTLYSDIAQHTDIYNSLKRLVWHWYVAVDGVYNDVFTNEINRNRWITNSEFYENNRYTVSSYSGDIFLFKNISSLPKDSVVYDYFSSYVSYEFWDEEDEGMDLDENVDKIKFIGHRWATENSPENTFESFLAAKDLWADGIEFDVSYTKDQENIVAHGDLLYASNCWKQKVWNLNFDWIQKNCTIQNWEKYRKLQKMLELVDWLFDYYFLEIKVYDESLWAQQAMDAIQTVKDLNMQDRVIFISYSDAAREVLNSDPDIIFGWDTFDVNDLDFIWENNSKYFLAPYDSLTPEIVQKARDLWKEVVTYTVNEIWDFQSMKDLWVNIIMSDRIDLLQEYNSTVHYPVSHSLENLNLKKSSEIVTEDLDIKL